MSGFGLCSAAEVVERYGQAYGAPVKYGCVYAVADGGERQLIFEDYVLSGTHIRLVSSGARLSR